MPDPPVHRDHAIPTDIEPADVPIEETRCPNCGHPPTPAAIASHRLSQNGYLHDDVRLECTQDDCTHAWTLGIPIGTPDTAFYHDLLCSCGEFALIHRIQLVSESTIKLHLKCPHCYTFFQAKRRLTNDDIALVGYPHITGTTEGATPYGYTTDDDDPILMQDRIGVDTDHVLPQDDDHHGVIQAEPATTDQDQPD